ncbi:winged helix DNA-binding domain-containing protein [Demequina flava]|uniref:winged helix DNA-binding domain-containing protein n=1 Tax=Demequina flava TaxID=1095025 RepID=UPI00078632B4|nr:winged helix DNA-binding domain-containing protein [Demequina flava]
MLTRLDIRALRQRSLLLDGARLDSVDEIVTWFGAMQAQDLASGLWSLGMRLAGNPADARAGQAATLAQVEAALEAGEALRTWPMRGTIHLVPSRDARWMLDLMGAKPLAGAAKRREYLGLTDDDAQRTLEVLGTELRGARLTRDECIGALTDAGVNAAGQTAYHLLWFAAQSGLTCIAPHRDGKQTFALLSEWAPDQVELSREQALATIAMRFVRSHGPVSVKDMARWTGLGVRDCRAGLVGAGDAVEEVATEDGPMFMAAGLVARGGGDGAEAAAVWVTAPGFDEVLLGYADRSAQVSADDFTRVVPGKNGVFRATLLRHGEVVGTWKRAGGAGAVVVDVESFRRLGAQDRRDAEHAFTAYGTFVGQPVEVRWG